MAVGGGQWQRIDMVQRDGVRGSHLGVCWWSCRTLAWRRRPVRGRHKQKSRIFKSLRSHVASRVTLSLLKFYTGGSATDGRRGGWEEVRERSPRGHRQEAEKDASTQISKA